MSYLDCGGQRKSVGRAVFKSFNCVLIKRHRLQVYSVSGTVLTRRFEFADSPLSQSVAHCAPNEDTAIYEEAKIIMTHDERGLFCSN